MNTTSMNKTKIYLLALVVLLSISATAQNAREEFKSNPRLSGSCYTAYIEPTEALTPAPKGYEAFYLTHYGRHGSLAMQRQAIYRSNRRPQQRRQMWETDPQREAATAGLGRITQNRQRANWRPDNRGGTTTPRHRSQNGRTIPRGVSQQSLRGCPLEFYHALCAEHDCRV